MAWFRLFGVSFNASITSFPARGPSGLLFKNCNEFDSSASRGPFSFTLGQGEVIQGWDTGESLVYVLILAHIFGSCGTGT